MTISHLRRLRHLFGTLLLVCVLPGCGQGSEPAGEVVEPVHLVETAPVISDSLSVVRTRTGTLREVRIYTQEEERITALPGYEGDVAGDGTAGFRTHPARPGRQ